MECATDKEEINMPHSARNRRNRKGRNNRRPVQRQQTLDKATKDNNATIENPKSIEEHEENLHEPKTSADAKTNDSDSENTVHSGKIQQENNKDDDVNVTKNSDNEIAPKGVTPKSHRYAKEEKCRIEIGTVQPGIKVMKITTISSSPLEAKIDHIPGVGIVETGSKDKMPDNEAIVTISEPVDSFSSSTTKVDRKNDPNEDSTLTGNKLQIRDVSDCDTVETDNVKPVIVEMESDVEREPTELATRLEADFGDSDASKQDFVEPRRVWDSVMPHDVERKLRSFIESLKLPTYAEDVVEPTKPTDHERISGPTHKKVRKRATFEAQHAHLQAASRFLDIIQEEGEKLSEDEEQHIRDFINEEIGKYRRKERCSDRAEQKEELMQEIREEHSVKIDVTNVDEEMSEKKEDADKKKGADKQEDVGTGRTVKLDRVETELDTRETRKPIDEDDESQKDLKEGNLKLKEDNDTEVLEGKNVNVEDESVGSESFKIEELEQSIEEDEEILEKKDDNYGKVEEVVSEPLSDDSISQSDSKLNVEDETSGQMLFNGENNEFKVLNSEQLNEKCETLTNDVRIKEAEKVSLVEEDMSTEKQSEISDDLNIGARCTTMQVREDKNEELKLDKNQDTSNETSEESKVEQLEMDGNCTRLKSEALIEKPVGEEKLDLENNTRNSEANTLSEETEESKSIGDDNGSKNEVQCEKLVEEKESCMKDDVAEDSEGNTLPENQTTEAMENGTRKNGESSHKSEIKSARVNEESSYGITSAEINEKSSQYETEHRDVDKESWKENETKSIEINKESSESKYSCVENRTDPKNINISESSITKSVSDELLKEESCCIERKHSEVQTPVNVMPVIKTKPCTLTPPKRSCSLSDIDFQEKTTYSGIYDRNPPTPPLRRKREVKKLIDVDDPPSRPPLPKENLSIFDASFRQPLEIHSLETPTMCKNIGSLRTLLTIISRSDASVRNIRDALSTVDSLALAENVRKIIDDLRRSGRRACLGSDITELHNYLENGAELGNGATPEITHDYLNRNIHEKSSARSDAHEPVERIVKMVIESSKDEPDRATVSDKSNQKQSESKIGTSTNENQGNKTESEQSSRHHVNKEVIKSEMSSMKKIVTQKNISTMRDFRSRNNKVENSKDTRELTTSEEEFEEIYKYSTSKDNDEVQSYVRKISKHDNHDQKDREKFDSPSEILDSTIKTHPEHFTDKEKSETVDYQGHDSSSSATTLSTVKYNPADAWQADIYSIIVEEARKSKLKREAEEKVESSSLKNKLPLLKSDESFYDTTNCHEVPVTPEPIPYSPVEDLCHAIIDSDANYAKSQSQIDGTTSRPESLKDLSIKKILSMPYGLHVINEITMPKFNIFKSLRSIPKFTNNVTSGEIRDIPLNMHGVNEQQTERAKLTTASSESKCSDPCKTTVSDQTISEQLKQKELLDSNLGVELPKSRQMTMAKDNLGTWVGLSTTKDPRLLVCLSPSQQKTAIKTSADDLLDLHRKFLNRHSYFDEEPPPRIPVPKYRVELLPMDESNKESVKREVKIEFSKPTAHDARTECDKRLTTNRLLDIIKENSDNSKHPYSTRPKSRNESKVKFDESRHSDTKSSYTKSSTLDNGQERLKVTRLCDWLNLARREPVSNARHATSLSDDLLIESSGEGKERDKSRFSERIHGNQSEVAKESGSDRIKEHVTGKRSTPAHFINAALIVNSLEKPEPPVRSPTPFNKSPITLNSAIIDKSAAMPDTADRRTPPRRTIDPRYNVNPALIDNKVEVPPRLKRVINVDKSCIDTTSIFDQNPPRSHLEPRRYKSEEEEHVKQVAATEIMQNLKKLQTEAETQLEGHRKYSLPQEYFVQQLKYIELLENQLKNVILAEEEEKEAFETFQTHAKQQAQEKVVTKDVPKRLPSSDKSFDRVNAPEIKEKASRDTSNDESWVERQSWQEKSEEVKENYSETINKHGHKDFLKKVHHENGFHEEECEKRIEHVEQHSVMTKKGDKVPEKMKADRAEQASGACKKETTKDERRFGKENTSPEMSNLQKTVKVEKPSVSTAVENSETFRQRMYDEYVHKVLEREERKHHKVVKISTHEDIQKLKNNLGKSDMSTVEKEFIEKARSRLNKFGINLDESESESDKSGGKGKRDKKTNERKEECHEEENIVKVKCLIDGKEFEDAKKLPKHLQEFLTMSATFDDGESHRIEDCSVISALFSIATVEISCSSVDRPIFEFWKIRMTCRILDT